MASIGVRLPLQYDSSNGFGMLKTLPGMVKQNFKMLLFTIPGERIMQPNFGVGVLTYLMSNFSEDAMPLLRERIYSQTELYLPVITIEDIEFSADPDSNFVQMRIIYRIPRLGIKDFLDITT
tara:strand:+ start:3624 stop:3989 length:366 start_codon:yes stop_codon:yes gene_type:complete